MTYQSRTDAEGDIAEMGEGDQEAGSTGREGMLHQALQRTCLIARRWTLPLDG